MATSLGGPGWRSLIQGAGLSLVLRLAGAGLGLAFNLLLARTAGAEGTGLFFLAFSISGLVALAARLGLDAIAMRQTAAGAAKAEWGEVAADGRAALVIVAAMALLATLALWLVAPLLADRLFAKPALVPVLQGLALTIAPMSLTTILAELLRGLHSLLRSQALQALIAGAVALPFLALAGARVDAEVAVWAQVAGNCVACALGALWWRQEINARLAVKSESDSWTAVSAAARCMPLLRAGGPLFWFSMLNALMGTFDVLMLGAMGTVRDVGIYGTAVRFASLTSFLLLAANSFSGPHYAAAYAKGETAQLEILAVRSARLTTLAASPLLVLFLAFPSSCLELFGKDFSAGWAVLLILSFGRFINLVTGSAGQVLIMTGCERDVRNLSIICAIITVGTSYFFITSFGAIGAAASTAISGIFLNVAATLFVFKRLGIWVHAFSSIRRGAT